MVTVDYKEYRYSVFLAVGKAEPDKSGTFDNKEQEGMLPGPEEEEMVPRHQMCAGAPT